MKTVECLDLSFARAGKTILQGITFDALEGTLTVLAGHNGAGKSTLLKILLGLIRPAGGSVSVLGGRPGENPLAVGHLPENVSFYSTMSVGEHIAYFARLKGVPREKALETASGLGLSGVFASRPGSLSKGQRQRLGLAQALLSSPKLILLDEPTVGLDPDGSAFMYEELASLRSSGHTVIVCTHELSLAEPYADKALIISAGRLRGFGSLEELRERLRLPSEIVFEKDPPLAALERFTHGGRILVPEEELENALRLITVKLGRFDFGVRKAGLREVYGHLMHEGERK